ncbi:M28 family peptidase [Acuticoccus sp. M5D2P5]|uniref:M28 family peptidase n=1 Tax=Acuticoccus kalidii TaxID=2910977 RepID=UPI001F2B28A2|nr:M28 family peptidase [Acuticoccus kalidii]MCF3935706.1 M28 family peptidase [Acuticoccus kalidii]
MRTIDLLKSEISSANLFSHLEEFARRVKLSGTPEELESFHYLEAQLAAMGYRTELLLHDAFISLPGDAKLTVNGEAIDCITHSFSCANADGLTAPVVYVGRGTEADFAAVDVTGKIALIDGLASPPVSRRASEAGASGQIHVSVHEHKHEMCISPVWGSPTDETAGKLPRTVVLTVTKADGDALKARVAAGPVEATLQAEVDTGWRKIPLLVGDMAGPKGDADEPFVMLSGHHDTWYYGVMDNGAANATMLEIARILAAHRDDWRRGFRVCFWSGHSHGRYAGSSWYAEHYWRELERRCAVHVNVDSTGGTGNVILSDMPVSAELRSFARDVVSETGKQEISGLRMSRAGDQSFWGIGVPSLFNTAGEQSPEGGENVAASIFSGGGRKGAGFGWWWHTPGDTIDKIDAEILDRDTAIYLHATWRLVADPVLPFDYAALAADLAAELDALAAVSAHGVDLEPARTRLADLAGRIEAFNAAIAGADGAAAESASHTLQRLSRHLVPIDYTSGDRFTQDPAVGQSPFPVLDPLRALAKAEIGSDAAKFCTVSAVRALNRVVHALDGACTEIDAHRAATKSAAV